MNKRNYQKELDILLEKLYQKKQAPTLLLHSCCAPCSSYVLEYLSEYFQIVVFYYNPNIYPESEYHMRAEEQMRFLQSLPTKYPVTFTEGTYVPDEFYRCVKGLEHIKEGGERCFACYRLRLEKAAQMAKEKGLDYFASTLSISPLKNSQRLNEIGEQLAKEYGISWLPNDFKRKMDINAPQSYQKNMACTDRIIVGVFIRLESGEQFTVSPFVLQSVCAQPQSHTTIIVGLSSSFL